MHTAQRLKQAKIAIRQGNLSEARRLLRQVVHEEPQNYVAWLLLARVTNSPQAAREYVKRAESLEPNSPLVHREMKRLDDESFTRSAHERHPRWRNFVLLSTFLTVFLFLAIWLAPLGWEQVAALRDWQNTETTTVLPTITSWPTQEQVVIAVTDEPVLQPTPTLAATTIHQVEPTATIDIQQALMATIEAGNIIEEIPTATATEAIPENDQSPTADNDEAENIATLSGLSEAQSETEIAAEADIEQTASSQVDLSAASSEIRPPGVGPTERWIDVNLNAQTLVAYEGDTPVFNSLISSGMWNTPTVTGQFKTWIKYESQDMNGYLLGYDYYLEDVPYVMYFYKDFAIHGAYWHNNFGTPMSHGCVNVSPADAGWLFNWAPLGTTVNIH